MEYVKAQVYTIWVHGPLRKRQSWRFTLQTLSFDALQLVNYKKLWLQKSVMLQALQQCAPKSPSVERLHEHGGRMRFRRLSEVNVRLLPRGSFRYRAGACKQSIAYWVRPMQSACSGSCTRTCKGCESPTVCFDNPATGSAARTRARTHACTGVCESACVCVCVCACVCVCPRVCVCMYV